MTNRCTLGSTLYFTMMTTLHGTGELTNSPSVRLGVFAGCGPNHCIYASAIEAGHSRSCCEAWRLLRYIQLSQAQGGGDEVHGAEKASSSASGLGPKSKAGYAKEADSPSSNGPFRHRFSAGGRKAHLGLRFWADVRHRDFAPKPRAPFRTVRCLGLVLAGRDDSFGLLRRASRE